MIDDMKSTLADLKRMVARLERMIAEYNSDDISRANSIREDAVRTNVLTLLRARENGMTISELNLKSSLFRSLAQPEKIILIDSMIADGEVIRRKILMSDTAKKPATFLIANEY